MLERTGSSLDYKNVLVAEILRVLKGLVEAIIINSHTVIFDVSESELRLQT